ncbi:MAG TPA: hypothetical protein VG937_38655 [Polyangiaceae bacterium]|nr:hypothetical protein [Polyangiaceae bacterium]
MNIGAKLPARRYFWLLLGVALGSTGCRKRATLEQEQELARTRCASACASLLVCASDEPALERQARCLAQCAMVRSEATRAGCEPEQDRALGCASTTRVACERLTSTRSALEQGLGLDGCQPQFAELSRCGATCREAGVVRSASRRLVIAGQELEVKAEQVSLGCGPQRELPPKAPPGSACEHFSVCTPARCPCPGSNAAFAARVCVDGRCASAERACQLGPGAVGYDACKGR